MAYRLRTYQTVYHSLHLAAFLPIFNSLLLGHPAAFPRRASRILSEVRVLFLALAQVRFSFPEHHLASLQTALLACMITADERRHS
jgi:hypothetical protein